MTPAPCGSAPTRGQTVSRISSRVPWPRAGPVRSAAHLRPPPTRTPRRSTSGRAISPRFRSSNRTPPVAHEGPSHVPGRQYPGSSRLPRRRVAVLPQPHEDPLAVSRDPHRAQRRHRLVAHGLPLGTRGRRGRRRRFQRARLRGLEGDQLRVRRLGRTRGGSIPRRRTSSSAPCCPSSSSSLFSTSSPTSASSPGSSHGSGAA